MDLGKIDSFGTEQKQYLLLNKDTPIASFTVNDAGLLTINKKFNGVGDWIKNLSTFIVNRRAPKHRENIEKLLKESGCDTTTGFLDITHALSLIDTFWVKSIDSELQWKDVSLFTHPFNDVVAKTAFEGGLHGRNLSTTSPEYGTDGSFAKCWVREDGQVRMLKRGSSGAANAGLEPYSEYYACQLIEAFTSDFVPYDLRMRSKRICSVCDLFTSEEVGFVPFAAFCGNSVDINAALEIAESLGILEYVKRMFVIDAVIMNEDRHTNNFGVLVDNDRQVVLGPAPLFDQNLSLLPYGMEDDFEDMEQYLSMKGPRLGEDWIPVAKAFATQKERKELRELLDFKFQRHPNYNLPEWRLEALENVIHSNIAQILKE
jgi:hypothetical protein